MRCRRRSSPTSWSSRRWSPLPSRQHLANACPAAYFGLMLFYPALQVVDLLELAAQIYQLAGMVRFGVQQVFTELFCLALPRLLANRHCEREGGVNGIDNPGTVARLLERMETSSLFLRFRQKKLCESFDDGA